jgi:CBS domain containing-hemolysin-like protein
MVLSRLWWVVTPAGSWWAPLARPVARLLRGIKEDPLPRAPAAEELMVLAEKTEGISPLEQSMLRSVMDFRRLTAGSLALPVESFPCAEADRTLAEMLADRRLAEARQTLVLGADGAPLGAVVCGAAALSGALSARAQSFARPLLSFSPDLPAWQALARLRRSPTPVAEVREEETGRVSGILTEQSVMARLLGQEV